MSVIRSGQKDLSGGADQLSTITERAYQITINALDANANEAYVGPAGVTTSTGYPLSATAPGSPLTLYNVSPDDIYVIGTATQDVGWIGVFPE